MDMSELEIRAYRESDQEAVVRLWIECDLAVPWNDPVKDINRKLTTQRELFLVGTVGPRLVATVMAGYDGHRGWINYLAVATDCQRTGVGRRLMDEAEVRLRELGCPKISLQVRNSNAGAVGFYWSLGYSVDNVISMGKRLEVDEKPPSASRPPRGDMTKDQYRELFRSLGIEDRGLGHVLRYGGLPKRVYFNRNRDVGIYFSAHGDDGAWYPRSLWEVIDPSRVQKVDHRRLNVVARSGMETGAFRNLVLNWQ